MPPDFAKFLIKVAAQVDMTEFELTVWIQNVKDKQNEALQINLLHLNEQDRFEMYENDCVSSKNLIEYCFPVSIDLYISIVIPELRKDLLAAIYDEATHIEETEVPPQMVKFEMKFTKFIDRYFNCLDLVRYVSYFNTVLRRRLIY